MNKDLKGVQVLVLVPTRELALQIEQVFKQLNSGLKVNCCYGGHDVSIEKNNLSQAPALLIATPGRMSHHIRKNHVDLSTVSVLVLDEFDKSLEFGFQKDMEFIVEHLENVKQKVLTSATFAEEIPSFLYLKEYQTINYLLKQAAPKHLTLKAIRSEGKEKIDTLLDLLRMFTGKSVLVFCNHRDAVDRISDMLYYKNYSHGVFHGGMSQDERNKSLLKFRNGTYKLLVTTDLAARGLDIPEIEFVVHYQIPTTEDSFIHRNGRTARMHAEGESWMILSEDEYFPEYVKGNITLETLPIELPQLIDSEWETIYFSAGKKEKINKIDIVGFILQQGQIPKTDLGLIEVYDHTSYAAVKKSIVQDLIRKLRKEKLKKQTVKIDIAS